MFKKVFITFVGHLIELTVKRTPSKHFSQEEINQDIGNIKDLYQRQEKLFQNCETFFLQTQVTHWGDTFFKIYLERCMFGMGFSNG